MKVLGENLKSYIRIRSPIEWCKLENSSVSRKFAKLEKLKVRTQILENPDSEKWFWAFRSSWERARTSEIMGDGLLVMGFDVRHLVLLCYQYIIKIFAIIAFTRFWRISIISTGSIEKPFINSHQKSKEVHSLRFPRLSYMYAFWCL